MKDSTSELGARIRIIIADDTAIIRQGLKSILEYENDLMVIAEADDGSTALEMVELHKPDVVLMDVSMPGGIDGVEATGRIIAKFPETKIIGLSLYDNDEATEKMLNAGAVSFVSKTNACEDLVHTIRKYCTNNFINSNAFKGL